MPITTKDEVKELLQIPSADTSKDNLITKLVTIVQDFIVRRINNFAVAGFFVEGYDLVFKSSDKTINSQNQSFKFSGFRQGDEIQISKSLRNNKIFTISAVADDKITVSEDLKDEDPLNDYGGYYRVIIQKIEFTEDIKLAAADFIAMKMNKEKTVKSRSLGDHSESFFNQQEMLETFSSFRKVQWE